MNENILIRPIQKQDGPYLYSTWLRHYKHSSNFAKNIPHSIFFSKHHIVISNILSKKEVEVRIACVKDDLDIIVGYLVHEPNNHVLHFCYVKRPFRNMGIAKELTKDLSLEGKFFTHWTDDTDWIVKKHSGLQYDPYAL